MVFWPTVDETLPVRAVGVAKGVPELDAAKGLPAGNIIYAHGCLVKDLDRGLVDFHALAGDRLVYLCWQVGEQTVEHWHTLDGGFSSRQSLHQGELE